jgi:enterochelin esterase family protein
MLGQERSVFVVLLLLAAASMPAPSEAGEPIRSGRLEELNSKYLEPGDVAGFWSEVRKISDAGGYPFVEAIEGPSEAPEDYVRVTFLHQEGDTPPENVLLFANVNHVLAEELLFEEIGQTGVHFKSVEVPPGVRFEYRITENDPLTGIFAGAKYGSRLHALGGEADPLNRNRTVYPGMLGEGKDYIESWVELPGASPQPYIVDRGNPRGELSKEEVQSELLGYSRVISTYLPPDYDPATAYPLMIIFDGTSYFSYASLQTTLENLFADGSIPPMIVLGVNAGKKDGQTQRNDEFPCNPEFMEFLNDELIPWFTSKYKVSSDPDQRVIAGSSYGGLLAAYFAFNHPEVVSNVLSQSGSFHWGRPGERDPNEWLVREFAFGEKKPISIFMEVGKLEGEYHWTSPDWPDQIVSHRHFKTILDMRGYDVKYQEYAGGHEMLSWRGGMAEGLKHLLGAADPN